MPALGIVVRRLLEGTLLLVGGLLVLVAVWFAVFALVTTECSVDVDDPGGVLVIGWAVDAGDGSSA